VQTFGQLAKLITRTLPRWRGRGKPKVRRPGFWALRLIVRKTLNEVASVPSSVGACALRGWIPAKTTETGGMTTQQRMNSARLVRLVAELAVAASLVAMGVRLRGTGAVAFDVVFTVLLLMGSANAVRLMDDTNVLASAVAAAGAAGALALSTLQRDWAWAAASGALVGACAVLLVFRPKPALFRILNPTGLCMGFTLAAISVHSTARLGTATQVAFPLMILALPFANSMIVVLGRLRHGQSIFARHDDHIEHRLANAGFGSATGVVLLIAVEAAMSGCAVSVARRALPLWIGALASLIILGPVVILAARVRVYGSKPVGLPRAITWSSISVVVAILGLAVPTALAALAAHGPALAAEHAAEDALSEARNGHLRLSASDFATAKRNFAEALSDLHRPLSSVGLAYPIVANNLRALRTLAAVGERLSGTGQQLAQASDRFRYQVKGGTVPVAELASTAPQFRKALRIVGTASAQLGGVSRTGLAPPVTHTLRELTDQLDPAKRDVSQAEGIATFVPPLLGLDAPRRYFLAFQTDSQSRATGGLIGLYGVLVASRGHLQLANTASYSDLDPVSPTDLLNAPPASQALYSRFALSNDWGNLNLSPAFPAVGSVITSLFPQSGGVPVDGVVAMDSGGLADLLRLTGPVTVAGWPTPIGPENAAKITLYQSYLYYPNDDTARQAFLTNLVHTVFNDLSNLSLSDPKTLVDDLEPAIMGRHIQFYAARPKEEAYLSSLHMTGAMPPVRSDSLMVTTQNAAGNKLDYFLHRSIDYSLRVDPKDVVHGHPASAQVSGEVTVTLDNGAPASGLPQEVMGPYGSLFTAGENLSYVTLYTVPRVTSATWDSRPVMLYSTRELARNASTAFLAIPSDSTGILDVKLAGSIRLIPGGWYELDIPVQPLINSDHEKVTISAPEGWRVRDASGAHVVGSREVSSDLVTQTEQIVRFELVQAG